MLWLSCKYFLESFFNMLSRASWLTSFFFMEDQPSQKPEPTIFSPVFARPHVSTNTFPSSFTPLTNFVSIKLLIRDNYLLWKAQVVPYLKGLNLYSYVDECYPCPSRPPSNTTISRSQSQPIPPGLCRTSLSLVPSILPSLKMFLLMSRSAPHLIMRFGPRYNECAHLHLVRAQSMNLHYQLAILKKGINIF